MRYSLTPLIAVIVAFADPATAAPPDYTTLLVGHWRIHRPGRPDRIVIFHSDGTWGVRNWDFSKPEDIRGRRWSVEADRLVLTYPSDHDFTTHAEKIVSITRARFVTEVDSSRFLYTRIERWPPKSP